MPDTPKRPARPVPRGHVAEFTDEELDRMATVTDEDIELTLSSLGANLQLAAQQLIQQACDNGGRDNVSVILVRVLKGYSARTGLKDKLKAWFK